MSRKAPRAGRPRQDLEDLVTRGVGYPILGRAHWLVITSAGLLEGEDQCGAILPHGPSSLLEEYRAGGLRGKGKDSNLFPHPANSLRRFYACIFAPCSRLQKSDVFPTIFTPPAQCGSPEHYC